jgi:hypothetical protein
MRGRAVDNGRMKILPPVASKENTECEYFKGGNRSNSIEY